MTDARVNTRQITDFFCDKVAGSNGTWNCVIALSNGREYAASLSDWEKESFQERLARQPWVSLGDDWSLCLDKVAGRNNAWKRWFR